jgi:hypothetical protein
MSMFLFFPAMMLSGMMSPVENMPRGLQHLALLDPIRHYLVVVRSVFLKGGGWWMLRDHIAALAVMAASRCGSPSGGLGRRWPHPGKQARGRAAHRAGLDRRRPRALEVDHIRQCARDLIARARRPGRPTAQL